MTELLAWSVAAVAATAVVVSFAQRTRTPRRRKTDVPNHPAARHSTGLSARNRLGTYTIPRPRSGADN